MGTEGGNSGLFSKTPHHTFPPLRAKTCAGHKPWVPKEKQPIELCLPATGRLQTTSLIGCGRCYSRAAPWPLAAEKRFWCDWRHNKYDYEHSLGSSGRFPNRKQ